MLRGLLFYLCLCAVIPASLSPCFGSAPADEVKSLLERIGKEGFVQAILQLRKNRITVFVHGKFWEFTGPPSLEFITLETILRDLRLAAVDLPRLKEILLSDTQPSKPPPKTVSPRRENAPSPSRSLRKSAIECRVQDFIDYMSPGTVERLRHLKALHGNLGRRREALYTTARRSFGDLVQMEGSGIKFRFRGADPRWDRIFGPHWRQNLQTGANEPHFFMIRVAFGWNEECRVIQQFQACLEDREFCQETSMDNSLLQIKKIHGKWWLVDTKTDREWEVLFKMAEGDVELLDWATEYLGTHHAKTPYETLLLHLAEEYTERLQRLIKRLSILG